jgi:HAD superfamily hydrolase (TIGR01549 family)
MFLFDLDGTIVNSSPAILGAYRAALVATLGFDIDPDEEHVHELLRRRPIEYFQQHYPLQADELADNYAQKYRSDAVTPFAGMCELVIGLAEKGAVGIVSNKGRDRIISDLTKVGVDPDSMDVIIGAEDTPERKPHPAPILRAVDELGIAGRKFFYVGDGPHDVEAARGADAIEVAVTWGYYPRAALSALTPHHIVSDVGSLKQILLSVPT